MVRSFTNRIFGGVCGGLAQSTPLSAALWRLLFMFLTLFTAGTGALVYVLWWWLLPLDSPLEPDRGNVLVTLFAFFLGVGIVVLWFVRATLPGQDLFLPLAALMLTVVFCLKQLAGRQRRNLAWGLVAVALAAVWVAGSLGVLDAGINDLILRGSPVLLVFIGLSLLLHDRLPLGGFVALALSAVLVSGVAYSAYSARATQTRTENPINVNETLSEDVSLLQINVETLETTVEFVAGDVDALIDANFVGSRASAIQSTYDETSGVATLTLREVRPDTLPPLDEIGRGTLRVVLPQRVPTAIAFAGLRGQATFDLDELDLERLNLNVQQGDVLVTLPLYQPQSPSAQTNPGEFLILNGDLRILVPDDVAGEFILSKASNRRPNFPDVDYALEDNIDQWILRARQAEALPAQIRVILNVPGGNIQLDTAGDA